MSSGEKFLNRKKTRCIELTINRQTIVDQMAAWLYANSIINDNEEITNIQFQDLFGSSDTELVPLKVYFRPEGGAKQASGKEG